MKIFSNLLAGFVALAMFGCSSSSGGGSVRPANKDASTDVSTDAPPGDDAGDGAVEAGNDCESVDGSIFVADAIYFGEMDWDGKVDDEAWMLFGGDIDGVSSTASSTGLCQPAGGAAAGDVYPDGDGGVDNAFGRSVLPLLLTLSPDFPARVNSSISQGDFAWMLKLDPFGSQPNQSSITIKIYAADSLPAAPAFDGSDCWPVAPTSLSDESDFESANISFPNAKMVSYELTTGTGEIELAVPLFGTSLRFTANHARIVIQFDTDTATPPRGIISGVLDTDEFIEEARDVLGYLDSSMCSGPSFEAVAASIRRASDIMKDGTQDSGSTCDGISVGLGFTLSSAGYGGLGSAEPPPTDPCP